jgi:hypothetical protein
VCAGIAVLTGCNISGPQIDPSGAMEQSAVHATASANLYVANGGNRVTVYSADAQGNVKPVRTIGGSNTALNWPFGIALDADKSVSVTNFSNDSVTVHAAGANGDVAPIQIIRGSKTELKSPGGIALDVDRNAYVANFPEQGYNRVDSVTVYPSGASGGVQAYPDN